MRIVFAGTPAAAVPSLAALLGSDHEVVAVVTRPPARAGRGRHEAPSPVADLAAEHSLELLTPRRPGEADFLERLGELAPDVCAIVAYGALVPRSALDVPAYGWVNLHFSLLPAWRGAAPVQAAIRAGDEITGASTFVLEEGLDTGPVLGTMTELIRPRDTAGELLDRLATGGAGLLLATMDAIAGGSADAVEQPTVGVSLAPKVTVEDAHVRLDHPAAAVDRHVRSCTPAPGAWVGFRDERLKLGPVQPGGATDDLAPGALLVERDRVLAGTATTPVQLGTVQPPSKRPMPAADWARGARPGADERLA